MLSKDDISKNLQKSQKRRKSPKSHNNTRTAHWGRVNLNFLALPYGVAFLNP